MTFIDLKKAWGSLTVLRRTWPQLLVTVLLTRVLAIVVLTPLVSLLVQIFLTGTKTGVLTDEEILVFLLHPTGMAALLVVGSVVLALLFAEQGLLTVIAYGALEDRRVTYLDAFRHVSGRWSRFLSLGGHLLMRLIFLLLPFILAAGIIFLALLDRYDINFYLARKPPEFLWAMGLAGLLAVMMGMVLTRKFSAWILVLPMILFQGHSGGQALRASAVATAGSRWRIARWLLVYLFIVSVLATFLGMIINLAGYALLPRDTENLALLALGLGVVFLLGLAGNQAVTILATVLLPITVARFYDALPGKRPAQGRLPARGSLGPAASLQIPGRAILTGGVVVLGAVSLGAHYFAESVDGPDQVQVIAHRGASAAAPENTMAAFDRAIADHTDWIELDVQEDADGVVVVQHDKDFMKVAHNPLQVADATAAALRDLDIGSSFDPAFAAERVPTLRQVLLQAKGNSGVVIELKYYGRNTNLESRVVEVVEETRMAGDIMIMSLKYDGVRKTAALRPDWTYGLLTTVNVGDPSKLDVDFLAVNAAAASPLLIRDAHRRGMKIYVWTINDPLQMSVMISRGADGLITDMPGLARRVIAMRQDASPLERLVIWLSGETGLLLSLEEASPAGDA